MNTRLTRALGNRFGPVRLVPLLAGVGYLLFVQRSDPTAGDWLVTLAAGLVFLPGGVWPLAVTCAEAALVVAAHPLADATPVAVKVLAGVALLELAVRRPLRVAAVGTAAVTCAFLAVAGTHDSAYGFLAVVYRILCVTVAPLLVGAYLRAARQALAEARARAEEAEARRVSEARGARLAERTELARELHDLVAHHVASIALRVGVARAVLPGLDPKVGAVLDDVHASAGTALADLRRMVGVLRDPAAVRDAPGALLAAPDELPAALATVVDRSRQAGLDAESHVDPDVARLDAVRGLVVLRVVQEALTNTAKHAGAGARARVSVSLAQDEVGVEVRDEGGTPAGAAAPPVPAAGPGYGLTGLRERVGLVDGTLTAGPHGTGWRVRVTFPAGLAPSGRAPGPAPVAEPVGAAPRCRVSRGR